MAALEGPLDPSAYTHRPDAVELRETHISWVVLAGDRAHKLKKPPRRATMCSARKNERVHEWPWGLGARTMSGPGWR